jgi:hypothetical protein
MFPHEVDRYIDKIGWGKKFVRVKNGKGQDVYLILKNPDLKDRNWINFVYEDSLRMALEAGVLSEKELAQELELRGIWGPPQEQRLASIEKQLAEITGALDESREGSRDYKRLEKTRASLQKLVDELKAERANGFSVCAERWAEVNRMYAMVWCATLNTNETRHWPTWSDFEQEGDFEFIGNITVEINKNKFLSEKEVRLIARSPHWRFKWNGSKSCGALFGRPLIELDLEQQALVYWSQVYDSVYEAYERPSDDVIGNDALLDKWFEDQAKKRKDEKKKKKDEQGPLGISKKVARHGEVFVVVGEEIHPTNGPVIPAKKYEEVEALNSPAVQNWKKNQFEKIKGKQYVEEKDLRPAGDRESRGLIGSTDAVLGNFRRRKDGFTTRDVQSRHPGGSIKPGRQ